jgi:hypothetical protein
VDAQLSSNSARSLDAGTRGLSETCFALAASSLDIEGSVRAERLGTSYISTDLTPDDVVFAGSRHRATHAHALRVAVKFC